MKSAYHQAICEEMQLFAENPRAIFLGQQVLSEDFYNTLLDIPPHARREMPVTEELQLGLSIGLALEGYLPISIYQRIDFLPRAMDQIVNHLNLIADLSRNQFNPKVIIRTTVGVNKPMDTGLQHSKDLTTLMSHACKFPTYCPKTAEEVHQVYDIARNANFSTLITEYQELY